jgi:N4-gp56 family major capsid protein
MVSPQLYGDITPRTAAYAVAQMLKRGAEELILEKFGQAYPIPTKSTLVAKFRRYNALALATTPLVEGVTPTGKKLTITDVTATLQQYGDWVPYTDVIEDTHEDPYLQQLSEVLMQQASETVETIRWNVVKAGTNVFYANGVARTDVNTPISLTAQRKVTRALKRQRGKHITSMVSNDPTFRSEAVEAAFVAICHSDVENDVRNMEGFVNTKQYGTVTPWANEIGAVEDVRYIRSTLFTPFADAGAATSTMVSTTGTVSDVYPVIYFARDAYGIVPLKGKNALSIAFVNPKPAPGDPLGQRGSASWKTMQTSVILNDAWLARLEVAATN